MKKKILLVVSVVLCAALLVAGSIAGTFAYLTSKITITNTFTVGNVKIDLTESLVNLNGEKVDEGKTRVHLNEYHLVPGRTYTKDPQISIAAKSESTYLFIQVNNGLQDLAMTPDEATDRRLDTIAKQIENNHWVELTGANNATGVYVYAGPKATNSIVATNADVVTINVFETFTVSNYVTDAQLAAYDAATIEITAYAVQSEGFENPADAWNKTFGADPATTTTPPADSGSGEQG